MTETSHAAAFPPATERDWRALVDKVLKGADFDRRLVARTADDLRIRPLYVRNHAEDVSAPPPGMPPLTRGSRKAGDRSGWDIRQHHAEADPKQANIAILEDLAGGVDSISLGVAAPGIHGVSSDRTDMSAALAGAMLDVCPVHLVAGGSTPDAVRSLIAIWRDAGLDESRWIGGFGWDPLGSLAKTGALGHSLPRAFEIAAELVTTAGPASGLTALRADGQTWHMAGATEAQELAAVLASLVAYLRAVESKGIHPSAALPKMAVTLAIDADQFLGIAKLRALRKLVWRVADACGAADAAAHVPVCAETSARMLARRDPWVNMLRTTIACAAAGMGGADAVTVLPYTWPRGQPDAFARRIARNTHHVLMEESALGRVTDPAGGSWYVERLTADLAGKAWEVFQAIEARGGLGAALTAGWWQDELARSAEARADSFATGRSALTGTSTFPRLGDDGVTVEPWPDLPPAAGVPGARIRAIHARRDAEPFEALRDRADAFETRTGQPPTVFLASLGALAEHATRTTWMQNFLAAAGIASIVGEGFLTSTAAGQAFGDSGASIAVLCASDGGYAELGEATASLLKSVGAKRVYLAGKPRGKEAALAAAGVDDFIFAGIDAVSVLRGMQEELNVR